MRLVSETNCELGKLLNTLWQNFGGTVNEYVRQLQEKTLVQEKDFLSEIKHLHEIYKE